MNSKSRKVDLYSFGPAAVDGCHGQRRRHRLAQEELSKVRTNLFFRPRHHLNRLKFHFRGHPPKGGSITVQLISWCMILVILELVSYKPKIGL